MTAAIVCFQQLQNITQLRADACRDEMDDGSMTNGCNHIPLFFWISSLFISLLLFLLVTSFFFLRCPASLPPDWNGNPLGRLPRLLHSLSTPPSSSSSVSFYLDFQYTYRGKGPLRIYGAENSIRLLAPIPLNIAYPATGWPDGQFNSWKKNIIQVDCTRLSMFSSAT